MRTILLVVTLLYSSVMCAQNTIALPDIINYPKNLYKAGTQNWDVKQDSRGILYFANNEGLLVFDGTYWKKYKLPNETIIRSIAVTKDDRIYVGAQNEIGYFSPGKNGNLVYTSLNNLIPDNEKGFADVWDIVVCRDQLFFRSNRRIFHLNSGKISVYTSIDWNFIGCNKGEIIAHDYSKGYVTFRNGAWYPAPGFQVLPADAWVTAMVVLNNDSTLVVTNKHGLYLLTGNTVAPFRSPDIQLAAAKNIVAATVIDTDHIALATSLGGCFIINLKGILVQRLSKQDGLQNNNIQSILLDRNHNLWLGLDNGIDFIAYNNAIKHIFPDDQEHSAGYVSLVYKNDLYIGTSNGLYKAPLTGGKDISLSKSRFTLIPHSQGQVWNLAEVNGQLLMGHTDGAYLIKNNTAVSLDKTSGFWTFMPLYDIQPSPVMVTGTYNGINFYHYENGKFVNHDIHSHFESARYVAIDNNTIWVSHPYKGVYRINFNNGKPNYEVYKDHKGILSSNRNHLFKIKNRVVLTTDKGIFEYNPKAGDFERSAFFTDLFGQQKIQYLKEDDHGNIWFITGKKLGVADFSGTKPQLTNITELNDKIVGNGFEFIYPYDDNNVFVAGEEGFYLVNYAAYKSRQEVIPVLLRSVKVINKGDSLIYGGYNNLGKTVSDSVNNEPARISYALNSLHFEYASPVYGQQANLEYAYQLKGFETGWSEWSSKNEKDYTNLPPGSYTFLIKARKHGGEESAVTTYRFVILAPWYQSWWAQCFYLLAGLFIIYLLYKNQAKKFALQQQRHEEEQKRLQYLHQLEMEHNENEIIRLRNEKLESEIEHKNTELASSFMNLVQKGEVLTKIKEEFVKINKSAEKEKAPEDYKKIIRMLEEEKIKKDWDQFIVHFDKVHSDFFVSLKKHFPNLTPSELKLCAYLRLNLSTKEIAQIMNITIKSAELSRYRLRKKLQVPTEVSLFNFLLNFHSDKKEELHV
ncbi:ligand-binding sensor domain-containing protein [Sediminibacterium ginsengisoli]|uniref:Two component regulator propeller n=1 Tax=Sediminibacterium ginsengisoli TaxID=413434 RepID=A0A1T4Q254_9BACT|nr:triple tyrosine motif-containing protein [Sediminibacterium ginsengisoli]SJZ97900.1 Two component regulator propeller [Sediminibacterium ginsengisoli]